jgi:hypothetical protein
MQRHVSSNDYLFVIQQIIATEAFVKVRNITTRKGFDDLSSRLIGVSRDAGYGRHDRGQSLARGM